MKNVRKNYQCSFKSKVALEAISGELTLSELAARHGVSAKQIGRWKQQALEGISSCFSDRKTKENSAQEVQLSMLHEKIGELLVERDFLLKASGQLLKNAGRK